MPLLALLALALVPALALGGAVPAPRGAVNDFAGLLSEGGRARMEALSRQILDKTGASVVVAVVADLDGDPVEDYAHRLFEAWGVGKKGEDRGVLILLAVRERKIRIQTGYGVEALLPDGKAGRILDQQVLPLLRRGNYDEGLLNAVAAVGQALAAGQGAPLDGVPTPGRPAEAKDPLPVWVLAAVLALLAVTRTGRTILAWLLLSGLGGGGRRSGGFGGFGGFGGGGFGGFGGGMSGGGGASRGF